MSLILVLCFAALAILGWCIFGPWPSDRPLPPPLDPPRIRRRATFNSETPHV